MNQAEFQDQQRNVLQNQRRQNRDRSAMPNIDDIIAFENGEMDEGRFVAFFQDGIDRGWVWQLQGFYGRTANNLIDAGLCTR